MLGHDYEEDRMATPAEACKEYARNVGMDNPDQPWILTDWDTWEPNPCYSGPSVPHPEDDHGFEPHPDDCTCPVCDPEEVDPLEDDPRMYPGEENTFWGADYQG